MSIYNQKNVAILGMSVEGIDSTKYFIKHNAVISCFDRREAAAIDEIKKQLPDYPIQWHFGPDCLTHLDNQDMYVRSPGMSLRLPELINLQESGKEVTSLTKLFFQECKGHIIGVTGTKGKGTTSTLIARMIKASHHQVYLGGNVGVPLLSKVDEITPSDYVVLELSSFQLEDLAQSPQIAVVLRITSDHLANFDPRASNFHSTRDAYVDAKKSIVRYQRPHDIVIYQKDDATSTEFSDSSSAQKYSVSMFDESANAFIKNASVYVCLSGVVEKICDLESLQVRGMHNLENIAFASLVAKVVGIDIKTIRSVVQSFEGLPHRLQCVGTKNKVTYYNDSFSTVPETAIAAIRSFREKIVLIVGGSEKMSDFTELGKEIAKSSVSHVVCIGAMTDRLEKAIHQSGYRGFIKKGLKSMHEIVNYCASVASEDSIVLLSPACASFDMFKNYKERGEQFIYEVSQLPQ